MNIFEMLSFDFKEFITSTAGILIIIGIICLLVGIVMYLKEGKKKPEEVKEEKPAEATAQEVSTEAPKAEETTEAATTPVEEKPVVESVNDTAPLVVPSEGDGVKEVAVASVAETINFSEPATTAPVVEDLKPETLDMPTVTPVESLDETPAVTPVVTPVESLDAEPATQPTIYGGASPEITNPETLVEKPREIYGGANPLENTAPIPTVTNIVEPATEATPIVEPVTEAPTAAPVVEPVTEAPTAAPVVEPVTEAPTPAPAIEPVTEAPTAAPVVEPVTEAPAEKKEEVEKLEF